MRAFAEQLISNAAVTAGLTADLVMRKADKASAIDPKKRLEMEFLPEVFTHSPRKIAAELNGTKTIRRTRVCRYQVTLPVRAEVFSDDEDWLARFVRAFIMAMPGRIADADNNLVKIKVEKATRGGFGRKMVEPFIKRSSALHLNFDWMLCSDQETAMIREITIVDGISIKL